ncbi:MAG: acyl-CoA dehydrogenase family protein [Pirellulaceae bacterium]|nr:acyl-CoA dehydrogenase family protein [Pirellulaceae bacterium]
MTTSLPPADPVPAPPGPETAVAVPESSFAETALKLGGKSDDEARRTGAIDRADDQVEQLFKREYQTTNSPIHRAIWDRSLPAELFEAAYESTPPDVQQVMSQSLEVVRRHRAAGTMYNADNKIAESVLADLAKAGYWGLLVDRQYGGYGAPLRSFMPFLTQMALVEPTIAGLASVHGCIGAVDPVRTFGSEEQKKRFLPRLASGHSLSAFALTEPCAGSDLTALRTKATLQDGRYLVNGEKLFITNVVPGRTIGLVCLIDDKPAVLICDLPERENEQFQLKKYGLYALRHTYNQGIVFRDFPVPAENLLRVPKGNGLTIAYHGLNLGRVALCATAAGNMRLMMASMIPWAQFRQTYGEPIARRELVRRRLGRLAGLIVGCDALVAWCSTLLDQGYRGEMECIVAKIFGSESQKEAAIELFMKTHGGRAFLQGHLFGDQVHEFLAPCIYEGEGEMLGMALFKSLVKQHGTAFFEPVGKALVAAGMKTFSPMNPVHVWKLRRALLPYGWWWLSESLARKWRTELGPMPEPLRAHAIAAVRGLQAMPLEISATLRKHQLKLADRQCRMSELSSRVQKLVVMLATSLYAAKQNDEVVRAAADILCQDLSRELTGRRVDDRYFRTITTLGDKIAAGGFASIAGLHPDEILMRYDHA